VAGIFGASTNRPNFLPFPLPRSWRTNFTKLKNLVRFDNNLAGWVVDSGRDMGRVSGEDPPDIFTELQNEEDNGKPNAVVDGLIDAITTGFSESSLVMSSACAAVKHFFTDSK
jgi:hypothetical protein